MSHDGVMDGAAGPRTRTCPSCDAVPPQDARFCPACGARLESDTRHEQRRFVTVLCCDLVDFTAACERSDPEDADALLREYSAMARREVETLGGRVEKFIGDAVLAIFGVPRAHEDDAARALHAALRIISAVPSLPRLSDAQPRVRIAVNTGEVLVRFDVDPASGQGVLVGDAVNTAARLQTVAPPMGVVAGELTRSLASGAFKFDRLEPVSLKGKKELVTPWLVVGATARLGLDLTARYSTALVDRTDELRALDACWEQVLHSRTPRLALLTGDAGIGKSRLVHEFAHRLDRRPEIIAWRQGSCPPYGDDTEYGALGQVVRAHAGIAESDDAAAAAEKLRRTVPDGPDAAWLFGRLRPLVGLDAEAASEEENFRAWRRWFEDVARVRPTVLVIEDLHWASGPLVAFLVQLVERAGRVPLLIVATTRPELAHPLPSSEGEGGRTTLIELSALTDELVQHLVGDLLAGSGDRRLRHAIAVRSGGNPLYAEECVRLLQDRVPASELGRPAAVAVAESALPGTLRALVAARLDTLGPTEHDIIADAAVLGTRFWQGGVVAVGSHDERAVEEALRRLADRELIRTVDQSSVQSEHEYVFWHAVTHDVAYDQLKRGVRAAKHEAAAAWIRERVGDGLGELAEDVARHYAAAMDLARAAGEKLLLQRIVDPAVQAFSLAGCRALGLDVAAAERHFRRALDLLVEGDPRRPRLLVWWADSLSQLGRFEEATSVMEEGVEGLRASGRMRDVADALPHLLHLRQVNRIDTGWAGFEALFDELDEQRPSPELVRLLDAVVALRPAAAGTHDETVLTSDRCLSMCRQLGLPESANALHARGFARCSQGDREGLADMRRAIEIGTAQGLGHEVGEYYTNLADLTLLYDGPASAGVVRSEGLVVAARRGDEAATCYLRTNHLFDLYQAGSWSAAIAEAEELASVLTERGDLYDLQSVRSVHALVLAGRGEADVAEPLAAWAEEATRRAATDAVRSAALTSLATVRVAQGRAREALAPVRECAEIASGLSWTGWWCYHVPLAARAAVAAGDAALAASLPETLVRGRDYDDAAEVTVEALVNEAHGDTSRALTFYSDAARRWEALGIPPEHAHAEAGRGRCLRLMDRPDETSVALSSARAIFATLGAEPAVAHCDALLSSPPLR